jgi:hypothetical protein
MKLQVACAVCLDICLCMCVSGSVDGNQILAHMPARIEYLCCYEGPVLGSLWEGSQWLSGLKAGTRQCCRQLSCIAPPTSELYGACDCSQVTCYMADVITGCAEQGVWC